MKLEFSLKAVYHMFNLHSRWLVKSLVFFAFEGTSL